MELKEKPKPGKGKEKTSKASYADKSRKAVSSAIPQKQASRMMKEKYIRELKDRPKGKEQEAGQTGGQAAEQVQDSGRWAAGELASASKRTIRQGREYAKEKAETAKRDAPIPPGGRSGRAAALSFTGRYSAEGLRARALCSSIHYTKGGFSHGRGHTRASPASGFSQRAEGEKTADC